MSMVDIEASRREIPRRTRDGMVLCSSEDQLAILAELEAARAVVEAVKHAPMIARAARDHYERHGCWARRKQAESLYQELTATLSAYREVTS